MNRSLAALLCLSALAGCTLDVTPDSLLAPDRDGRPLDIATLDGQRLPNDARLEPVTLNHADGTTSRGVHLVSPGSRVVIVYLTGNKMRLAEYGDTLLPRFARLGADVLWVDYRGFGGSDGRATLDNLRADTAELIDIAARERKRIVVHGLSMGSILAVQAAQDPRVAGLVLEGGITSIPQVVDVTTPEWVKFFIRVNIAPELSLIDNVALLEKYDRPLLIMVGMDDDETPPLLSERLHAASPSPRKHLLEVPRADHRTTMTFERTIESYRRFLDQYVLTPPTRAQGAAGSVK